MRRVLNAAADKFGHRFTNAPSKRGFGLACTDYKGTYVATMAEVKVDETTGRITCAGKPGLKQRIYA